MVVWLPDEHAWGVPSNTDPAKLTRVTRRKPANLPTVKAEGDNGRPVRRGQWWYFFGCDCPAGEKYLICWHRAAVYLWCKQYRNFDPDTIPLDTMRRVSYEVHDPVPGPEAVATIMQVAGPSTDDLRETVDVPDVETDIANQMGRRTKERYFRLIVDEGGAKAMAWLESLSPATRKR